MNDNGKNINSIEDKATKGLKDRFKQKLKDEKMRPEDIQEEYKKREENLTIENAELENLRIKFQLKIDQEIKKLGVLEKTDPAAKNTIRLLKKLRNAPLTDEEMQGFIAAIDNGLDVKDLPDLKKLFKLSDKLSDGREVGEEIRKLLSNRDYGGFQTLIKNPEVKRILEGKNLLTRAKKIVDKINNITTKIGKDKIKNVINMISRIR